MKNVTAAVARRLFSRRALPWLAWLGLFAAVAWGVFQFGPDGEEIARGESVAAEPSVAGGAARVGVDSAARSQIKQLFATEEDRPRYAAADLIAADRDASPSADKENDQAQDRYAASTPPPLPPLAEPTDEPADDDETATVDDDPAALSAPTADAEPLDPRANEPEVARGQDAESVNPLRQAKYETSTADDAKNAFAPAAHEPEVVQVGAAQLAEENAAVDEQAAALETAQPLPGSSSRYGRAPAPALPIAAAPLAPPSQDRQAHQPQPATARAETAVDSRIEVAAPGIPTPARTPAPSYAGASRSPQDFAQQPYAQDNALQGYAATPEPAATPRQAVTPTPGLTAAVGMGRPGERVLEGPQSPAITIHKLAPPEIQVGKNCTFAIRVQNNGSRAAGQVVIRDQVPAGTQLVGTAPRATVSGGDVQWDLGTLSVGEERIVEMELIPLEEGELGSVATVTFAAEASAKARCTKPELRLQLASEPRVMLGERHLVQVEISNPGSGDATNVMLLESLPPGVSHEAGPALEFEVGTLRAGETRKLELRLNAEQAGVIENVMTARADANLQATASCQFEVIAPALSLSVDGPKRKYLERPATFVVNIDNPGTASAKDVQLVAELPKGLKYVKANNMGEYDQATHSVYWSLAELPEGERGSVQLTALPIAPGEHTLRAATRAAQGLEDRAEKALSVEGMAALSFETRALENLIEIGGETTCEIRVTNRGSKAAGNVQVSATMPAGLRAVTAKGDSRHSLQPGGVTFAPLVQLAPGAEARFAVTVQGVAPGDGRIKVRVTSDDEGPITKEASARVYSDQ